MSTVHYSTSELVPFIAVLIRYEAMLGGDLMRAALAGDGPALSKWWAERGLNASSKSYARANAAANRARYDDSKARAVSISEADLVRAASMAVGPSKASLDRALTMAGLLHYNLDDHASKGALLFCLHVQTAATALLLRRCGLDR